MKRKVNYLIGLSFLLIIILGSSYAFSKYNSEVTGEAEADIANWNITVNDCSITKPDKNNTTCFEESVNDETGEVTLIKNFGVSEIFYSNNGNDNVVNNKIAPGSSGSFKIKIRPNDTEVSIKYTIKAWLASENVSIKLYRSDPNMDNKIPLDEEGYTGIIKYSPNNLDYEDVITIYVDWVAEVDEETNLTDTELGTNGGTPKLKVPVQIVFEQYNG